MKTIKLTRKWSPLTHLVGGAGPLLYYRRRAPGERAPYRFAVVRAAGEEATEASRSELRLALARLREPFKQPTRDGRRRCMADGKIGCAIAALVGEQPLESGCSASRS